MHLFGYVRAYKPEMKFKEYDVYKGVYCSLCKTLMRRYSPLGQIFLTYDATFMALALMAVSDECVPLKPSRCCYNPTKKCYSCGKNEILNFCADVSILLMYYKVLDDLHDAGFKKRLLSVLLFPMVWCMHRKAAKAQPEAEQIVAESMKSQAICEQDEACKADPAAEPSASALKKLCALQSQDTELQHLFYLLGRYVYLIDAVDDVEKDIKDGNFNPLKKKYEEAQEKFAEYGLFILNLNIGEMVKSFNKLSLKRYQTVLYNILFDGLYNSALYVTKKYKTAQEVAQ